MKKHIIIGCMLGIALISSGGKCFADDCLSIVDSYKDGNQEFNITKNTSRTYENILPKTAITQALLNLKKNCCLKESFALENQINCVKDQGSFEVNVPSSLYLFDHLFDIIMRRLDANPEAIYPALQEQLDPKGREWREIINKTATSTSGSTPSTIYTQRKGFREKDNGKYKIGGFTTNRNLSPQEYLNEFETKWKEKTEQYDERDLKSRYRNACELAALVYFKLRKDEDSIQKMRNSFAGAESKNFSCEEIVNQRIGSETTYVKSVITDQSNTLLEKNIKNYSQKYFIETRMSGLSELIKLVVRTFQRVERQINNLTPQCN